MPIIDELFVALGYDYDPEDMDEFKKDLKSTTDSIKALTKIAITGALAITGLTVASTRASDEQGKLAEEIGETVENVDALQFALRKSGGTVDGMTTSLRQLAIRASEAARGTGSGVEAFGILGISVTDLHGNLKPVSELMSEVSTQFQGLGKAQQIELADKLGIRDAVRLLQQGPEAIAELTAEAMALGVTTEEDAAISKEFQETLTDLWQIIKSISRTIARQFAPIMKDMVQAFTDWWTINRTIIEQKLPEWIATFTQAMKLLSVAVAAFLAFKLVGTLTSLIALLRGLTVATLATNAAALLLPVLIAAAALAFVALVEDAKVFFEGGDSFIGDMIKKFPEWAGEIEAVAAVLNTVAELTTAIFDGWSAIFDLFSAGTTFDDFTEVLKNIPGFFGDITGATQAAEDIGGAISTTSSQFIDKVEILVQGGLDTAENIAEKTFNVFQQAAQDLNSTVEQ